MAKERTTFGSHEQTAHVWAQQTVTGYGKASDGRINFHGDTIYSYGSHFPVARFVTRGKKRCVLFTTRSYSSSTGKHKSIIACAIRSAETVFHVHDVTGTPNDATIIAARKSVADSLAAFARSTPWNYADAARNLVQNAERWNELAKFFGIRKRVKIPEISDEVRKAVLARVAKKRARDDARNEQRRIADAARNARMLAEYRAGDCHGMRSQDWGLASTFAPEDHAAHDTEYAIIQADKIAAWRAGKPVSWGYSEERPTLLRVRDDLVQTSFGAEFPVSHAKRAFPMVAKCRENATAWKTNGHSIPLGNFKLDEIASDGTVTAGCHVVQWSEIERVARELGLVA